MLLLTTSNAEPAVQTSPPLPSPTLPSKKLNMPSKPTTIVNPTHLEVADTYPYVRYGPDYASFSIFIVTEKFKGKEHLKRSDMVCKAIDKVVTTGPYGLQLNNIATPDEWEKQKEEDRKYKENQEKEKEKEEAR